MLSNCEKIVLLPSSTTNNAWPSQPQDDDDIDEKKTLFMASTNRPSSMEKPQQQPILQSQQQHQHHQQHQQQQQQQQQQQLRCPRCDSSNTKFCYYNNYSLSQPRHFCKACKRYWTRGGTLRNVPVGGGCRKNKRSKRLAPASDSGASSTPSASLSTPPPPSVQASIEIGSRSSHLSSLFFGAIPSNPSEINVSFPNLNPSYDLPPHLNALGLGFSSGYENSYRNGFSAGNLSSIQDLLPPSSLLSSYNSIYGCSSTSSSTTIPTMMTSLIASSVDQQQKFINGGAQKDTRTTSSLSNFQQPLSTTFEDLQAAMNKGEVGLGMKSVKLEDAQNRLEWNQNYGENPMDQTGLPDPSSSWSIGNSVGPWHDQGSIGSSVPSLI